MEILLIWMVWFFIVWTIFPPTMLCMRNESTEGCRQRTLWEDLKNLWKAAVRTMVVWAFKDWVLSFEKIIVMAIVDSPDGYPGLRERYWFSYWCWLSYCCFVCVCSVCLSFTNSAVSKATGD